MSDQPFIGSLMLVGFTFPPRGWAQCDGQLMSIAQNQALFSLIGTFYGGDGRTTFGLPDLRGRVPVHYGQGLGLSPYGVGQAGGAEAVTLNASQMPAHQHVLTASGRQADVASPAGALIAAGGTARFAGGATGTMSSSVLAPAGGDQPHENRGPSLTLTWVIALVGIFPSRN